jgi:hypothetical protein
MRNELGAAQRARESEYNEGFIDGLSSCIDMAETIAWEEGVDLDGEDS